MAPESEKNSALWFNFSMWTVYTLVCAIIMLMVRFPGEEAQHLLQNILNSSLPPGFTAHVGEARATFPPGVFFRNVNVLNNTHDQRVMLQATDLVVTPSILSILPKKALQVDISASMYGGRINGEVTKRAKENAAYLPKLSFVNIDLARWRAQAARASGQLSGMASGWIRTKKNTAPAHVPATFSFEIHNGTVPIPLPLLQRPSIDFSSFTVEGSINASTVTVTTMAVNSDEFMAEFTGTILPRHPLSDSVLSLAGTITQLPQGQNKAPDMYASAPHSFAKKAIPVIIKGTFGAPRFNIRQHGN